MAFQSAIRNCGLGGLSLGMEALPLTLNPSGNHYQLLGVERGASDEDIKRAFRKQAKELHPDVNKEVRQPKRAGGPGLHHHALIPVRPKCLSANTQVGQGCGHSLRG